MLPPTVFESSFNQAPVGEYLLSPSDDPVIWAVNDAFLRTSGRTREDLVGQRLFVAFPSASGDSDDTNVVRLRESLARVLATRQADTLPIICYPIAVQQPDGSEAFEDRYWHAISTPVFDARGALTCIAHRTNDVTGSFRADESLRETQRQLEAERARLQTIVDTIPTGLIMLDEHGIFTLENAEWKRAWAGTAIKDGVADYSRYKVFRPSTGERMAPEEWPCAISLKQGINTKDVILDIERFDGRRGTIVVSSAPIRDATGRVIGAVAANMDITELQKAKAELQEMSRRKDEFLAMLAHELRNPLAPVAVAAKLLEKNPADPVAVAKKSAIISRQVRHMASLIDDLMDVSRVTRGLVTLEPVELDANQAVLGAVEQTRPLFESRGHELTLQLTSDRAHVHADATRLVQVLSNILANAAKYTPQHGHITIGTQVDADSVHFRIEDNGQGMGADLLVQCFDMFSQATRSSDRSAGGLGIGLALVNSLVTLQNGSVRAESEGEGQGSRFTVTLPRMAAVAQVEQLADVTPAAQPEFSANARRAKVLIVDDNQDAADTVGMLMESLGYEPVVEYHPLRALERLQAIAPDVCLLDIGLPDMSGHDLAQEIRKRLASSKVTLIGISGYGQPQDREAALRAGFDEHLVKPLDSDRLINLLAEFAALRG
jgi:signal transduction histidine kinase/CheY-like chemotaxis protein